MRDRPDGPMMFLFGIAVLSVLTVSNLITWQFFLWLSLKLQRPGATLFQGLEHIAVAQAGFALVEFFLILGMALWHYRRMS